MTKTYTIEDKTLDIQIIHKKRKSLGLYIDVYGNIELRAPKNVDMKIIDDLITKKWQWIIKTSDEMKEKTKGFKEKNYTDGESFLYLGQNIPLKIRGDDSLKKVQITLFKDYIDIKAPHRDDDLLKKAMTRFYKKQCKKLVEGRIRHYQSYFKTKPKSIKISANKKTWGTCNSLREMTFNYRLSMAPIEVLDYVVVHEMCHMVHMNHDRSFWRLVGKIIPDYEACQEWLIQSHWKMVV